MLVIFQTKLSYSFSKFFEVLLAWGIILYSAQAGYLCFPREIVIFYSKIKKKLFDNFERFGMQKGCFILLANSSTCQSLKFICHVVVQLLKVFKSCNICWSPGELSEVTTDFMIDL